MPQGPHISRGNFGADVSWVVPNTKVFGTIEHRHLAVGGIRVLTGRFLVYVVA